jgi:hypothetical protein
MSSIIGGAVAVTSLALVGRAALRALQNQRVRPGILHIVYIIRMDAKREFYPRWL